MTILRRFLAHNSGVSAAEFALAAPFLVFMLAGIMTGWAYTMQLMEMRTAVKTGANYVLQGGTDFDAAKSAILSSWTNKPEDADVDIVRQCTCAGTVSACSAVCTGSGSIPNMSVIITATGSVDVPLYSMFATAKVETSHEDIIRVR